VAAEFTGLSTRTGARIVDESTRLIDTVDQIPYYRGKALSPSRGTSRAFNPGTTTS